MFEEEGKAGIPESLTINGVTYTVKDTPELQKFIQEVAKVEKSKLYSQFENLKTQIANLGKVQITGSEFNVDSVVEKLKNTFVTKEDLKEVLPSVVKEVVQPVLTATENNRLDELKQYKEKIISENIDKCIPELVKGDTKEELDNSLKESIRLRAAYPTPSTANAPAHVSDPLIQKQMADMNVQPVGSTQNKTNNQPQAPTPTPPAAPFRPSPEVSEQSNVKRMTMDEFAKQRENLKAQLESVYGGGTL